MDLEDMVITAGTNKQGQQEKFGQVKLLPKQLYTIIGDTGSGKSRLIKDLEQLVDGDSVTKRTVLLNGSAVAAKERNHISTQLIAHQIGRASCRERVLRLV